MLTRNQEQNKLWHEIAKIVEKQYDDLQQDHDEKTKNEAKLAEWNSHPSDIQALIPQPAVPSLRTAQIKTAAETELQNTFKRSLESRGLAKKFELQTEAIEQGIDRVSKEMFKIINPDNETNKTSNFDHRKFFTHKALNNTSIKSAAIFLLSCTAIYLMVYGLLHNDTAIKELRSTVAKPLSFSRDCEREFRYRDDGGWQQASFQECDNARDLHYFKMPKAQYDAKLNLLKQNDNHFAFGFFTFGAIAFTSLCAALSSQAYAFWNRNNHDLASEYLARVNGASEVAEKYFETLSRITPKVCNINDIESNPPKGGALRQRVGFQQLEVDLATRAM